MHVVGRSVYAVHKLHIVCIFDKQSSATLIASPPMHFHNTLSSFLPQTDDRREKLTNSEIAMLLYIRLS